ncbi:MAG: hypothetical protein MUF63_16630 [Rhodobacteraceae bacterium]|nr:hypothetical protein [Paracoccaceae bacterium]
MEGRALEEGGLGGLLLDPRRHEAVRRDAVVEGVGFDRFKEEEEGVAPLFGRGAEVRMEEPVVLDLGRIAARAGGEGERAFGGSQGEGAARGGGEDRGECDRYRSQDAHGNNIA